MHPTGDGLHRMIGIKSLAANVVNLTIGAGIFVLPALVAERLGNASGIAYLICGALIFLIMTCLAEVGSTTTTSGGIYKYVESAFGPYLGFLTSNLYWLGFGLISDAAIANALFEIIAVHFPAVNHLLFRMLFFVLVFGALAWINIKGVQYGIRTISVLTVAKILPLVFLLGIGLAFIQADNLRFTSSFQQNNLGEVCLILFFAFVGGEAALTTGGEIKNPKRTVPFGLLIGISIVISIYVILQVVAQGVLGDTISMHKEAPLTELAKIIFGGYGPSLIIITTAMAILGAISGDILVMPRFLFAASRDRILPDLLSAIHTKYRTPYIAIFTYSFLAFVLALSGSFKALAILSSSANLITYAVVVVALWKLKINQEDDNGFRVPRIIIPIILVGILWLLSFLTKVEIKALLIFVLLSSIYYFRKEINEWLKKNQIFYKR